MESAGAAALPREPQCDHGDHQIGDSCGLKVLPGVQVHRPDREGDPVQTNIFQRPHDTAQYPLPQEASGELLEVRGRRSSCARAQYDGEERVKQHRPFDLHRVKRHGYRKRHTPSCQPVAQKLAGPLELSPAGTHLAGSQHATIRRRFRSHGVFTSNPRATGLWGATWNGFCSHLAVHLAKLG